MKQDKSFLCEKILGCVHCIVFSRKVVFTSKRVLNMKMNSINNEASNCVTERVCD